jgi:hypothetical protein
MEDTMTDDARIDRWNKGAIDGCRNQPPQDRWLDDTDYMDGYRHGQDERKVRVVMPERPEGYYHMPLGTFE